MGLSPRRKQRGLIKAMNLAVGAACGAVLRARPRMTMHARLFLVFAMAFNLFWGAGYFLYSAVTDTGDWAFVLRDLDLAPRGLWRCGMGILGVFLYLQFVRQVAAQVPDGTPLLVPYMSAGVVSCVAALFFIGPVLPAVREAAQESFGAGIGLLILAWLRRTGAAPAVTLPAPSSGWLRAAALVTLAFIATLGRGLVFGDSIPLAR